MMTKWDTIQADVADAYRHLDDVDELENEETEEEYFGVEIISLDELSDTELEEMEIITKRYRTRRNGDNVIMEILFDEYGFMLDSYAGYISLPWSTLIIGGLIAGVVFIYRKFYR